MTALRKTPVAVLTDAAPFVIRAERASDIAAREALLDASFGATRHLRTCQRLRDGHTPAEGLALSAVRQGRLIGTVRLWHAGAGGTRAGAWATGGRSILPQARHRCRADEPRARNREGARTRRGAPARRRALLCPLRFLGAQDR